MLIKFEVKIELPVIWLFSIPDRQEKVSDAVHGERRLAKDTHDFKDGSANLEVVLDDCDEAIGDDSHVYLYADGILRFSPEALDLEMLLNPFEEQLHLPAVFVKQGDILSAEVEVVGVVDEASMKFWRIIDNPSDNTWILFPVLFLGEADALVFEHIICSIENSLATDDFVCRPSLLPDDEECSEYVDSIKSGEVKVASVKHIARQGLVCKPVHRVNVMHFGSGDSIEHRNLCDDVNLGMDPDARLCASELCPSEYGHAEVDCSGVDGIEPAMKLEFLRDASALGNRHHVESELLKDAVVSERISLRQHLSVDGLSAKAEENRLLCMCNRNICKLPKASTAHELTEHQNQQVIPMRHRPTFGSVVVLGEYSPKLPLWEELGYLCKNELSCMHICSDSDSSAKVRISKPGQGVGKLKCCA